MGDLSKNTRSIFEKVKKSFSSAEAAFRANQQSNGLKILAEDLVHYVEAMVSALQEIMGELNKLETKLDKQEVKLDKLESKVDKLEVKFDKMEDKAARIEVKLDQRPGPVGVPVDPGSVGEGTVRPGFTSSLNSLSKKKEK